MSMPEREGTVAAPKHIAEVLVTRCNRPDCTGDEGGCGRTDCLCRRSYYWSHERFVHTFGRCPSRCEAPKPHRVGLRERMALLSAQKHAALRVFRKKEAGGKRPPA